MSDKSPLTRAETAVLVLLGKGKSVKKAARVLMCSRCTVATHIANIYNKLKLENRNIVSAVVKALMAGYIKLEDLEGKPDA